MVLRRRANRVSVPCRSLRCVRISSADRVSSPTCMRSLLVGGGSVDCAALMPLCGVSTRIPSHAWGYACGELAYALSGDSAKSCWVMPMVCGCLLSFQWCSRFVCRVEGANIASHTHSRIACTIDVEGLIILPSFLEFHETYYIMNYSNATWK